MSRSANGYSSSAAASGVADVRDVRSQNDSETAAAPFLVENETAYRCWRERKLAAFMKNLQGATDPVIITDPKALNDREYAMLTERCRRRNFVFYRIRRIHDCADKTMLKQFWAQLGLYTLITNPRADEENISSIEVTPGTRYIPYTLHPLKWHTDGYYNASADTICAFAMHCVRCARQGGENQYFDPEILYILLRDENPDYVVALMHPKTLLVPHNSEQLNLSGTQEARIAPVLTLHPRSGDLIVRYTERSHYVVWRKDKTAAAARAFIREVLQTRSKYRITHRLANDEGVICNNVLHNRSGFAGSANAKYQRLLYRARYHERIANTSHATLSEG